MKNSALNLTRKLILPLAVFCASQGAMGAVQVVTLQSGSLIQGIPTSFLFDQGWSYSAKLLDQMQTAGQIPASYGDYQFTVGTGTIPCWFIPAQMVRQTLPPSNSPWTRAVAEIAPVFKNLELGIAGK